MTSRARNHNQSRLQALFLLFFTSLSHIALASIVTLETEVRTVLDAAFERGEYLVYVTQIGEGTKTPSQPSGNIPALKIPYTSFEVTPLVESENSLVTPTAHWNNVKVTIVFDEATPEKKIETITTMLKERFPLEKNGNSLVVNKSPLKLVATPQSATETKKDDFEMQKTVLQKEQVSLEVERLKLELAKSQSEVLSAAKVAKEEDPSSALDASTPPNAVTERSLFEKFQWLGVATLISLALIVAFVIGFGNVKKGLKPVAEALGAGLESIGSNLGQTSSATPSASALESSHGHNPDQQVGGSRLVQSLEGASAAQSSEDTADIKDFTDKIREKIEILLKEGSFGFYKEFLDMIEQKESLPMAAALLLSLDKETTQRLLQSLSTQHGALIRDFLNEAGNLAKSRTLRVRALQEFYGRIAMDEFLDSPILKVGGMSWIAKLNNQEMAAVAAKLSAEDLPVFFACLSPVRVKNIIEQVNDNEAKAKFFLGLAQIATVTQEKVEPFFERLRTLEPKTDRAGGKNSSQLVNAEKYLKQAVDSMEAIDQEKVFSYLDQSSPVSQALRRQFLPFEAIRKVPVAIMRELFGERANDQIAQILFASPPDLRDLVLSSLPDIKQQTVKDKLKQLDGDSVYKKRHEQKSYQAQKAITSYIAQLLQEGIITLDDADGSRPLSEVNSAA